MKRKDFISSSLLTTAGLALPTLALADTHNSLANTSPLDLKRIPTGEKAKVCIFSKQLQWLNYHDLAKAVADMGYDGIDLTVRANGHVLPEKVETDLPRAVEAAEKAGIKVLMISTDIRDADEPLTKRILKTAVAQKIHYYRTSGLNYQKDIDIPATLEAIKKKFSGLAALNKEYGLYSSYLNHSGEGFGSSIWDLWLTIKDLDPHYIGSQYDIKHSTIAGAYSWPVCFKLIHPYVQTMVIRDFRWEKNKDLWEIKPVPIGEGMVDLKKYFGLVKQYGIKGPICIMCDYELGGAENGATSLTIPGKNVLEAMKKDLDAVKRFLQL
ncbi:sugar phosphate isomerase/epimerase family protein [Terrimonas alba]|uniref:sugar phosphate isomerase/epimerase family protein n=1 Tax=Terrimonas alba TaxID=3349636 RepID=UPI0035F3B7E0